MIRFFTTLLALVNSFVVIALSLMYFYGNKIQPNLLIAIALVILGIAGLVFAYFGRFKRIQVKKKVK